MIDLMQARRSSLECRGFQHRWDHGPAPIQRDDTQKPVVWVTRGHCTSCGLRRWRYLVPYTCDPLGDWEYSDPSGMRPEMHLVTQQEARVEIGRRDNVGEGGDHSEIANIDRSRKPRKTTDGRKATRKATG